MYKVAVVGAGVIGLTTAVRIQEELGNVANITIYTNELSPNTTGDISAGLWSPYLLQNTPDMLVTKWSLETQDYFHSLWKNGHASDAGLSLVPVTRLTTEKFSLPSYKNILIGFNEVSPDHLRKYQKEHNRNYTGGYNFVSFTCEPSKFLPFLQRQFILNGGTIEIIKITNFQCLIHYDVIVNCPGLGAKSLVRDDKMCAIRGQISRVVAPWHFHVIIDDSDNGNYIIPNTDCVILGGTRQVNDFDLEPRSLDTKSIINGCKKMVPSLQNSKLIKHMVGLRPGRDEVRLEMEMKTFGGKPLKIVHNYGHGGSGVTLSYGCANHAMALVKQALNCKHSSKL